MISNNLDECTELEIQNKIVKLSFKARALSESVSRMLQEIYDLQIYLRDKEGSCKEYMQENSLVNKLK